MPKQELLAKTGLTDTGESDEANESAFSVATLPTGWTVLWSNDELFAGEGLGARLSIDGDPVLVAQVNETCMHSTVAFFEGGRRQWRMHHEADGRPWIDEKDGALPEVATAIEAELRASQALEDAGPAEVDYLFDAPLLVAQAVCGFKHDQYDWGEIQFTCAVPGPAEPAHTSWLGRLLRRG